MTEVCLRCGRVPSDLIHDNPNDHGWTGTSAMHPFVDERGKWLLQWTAKNVFSQGKSGHKGSRLTEAQVAWNEAIGKAENAVAQMFAPLTPEALAEHDRYFADDYAEKSKTSECQQYFQTDVAMCFHCGMPDGHTGSHGWIDQQVLADARDVAAGRKIAISQLSPSVADSPTPELMIKMRAVIEAVRAVGSKGHWDAPHWTLHVPQREMNALFDLAYELDPELAALASSPPAAAKGEV